MGPAGPGGPAEPPSPCSRREKNAVFRFDPLLHPKSPLFFTSFSTFLHVSCLMPPHTAAAQPQLPDSSHIGKCIHSPPNHFDFPFKSFSNPLLGRMSPSDVGAPSSPCAESSLEKPGAASLGFILLQARINPKVLRKNSFFFISLQFASFLFISPHSQPEQGWKSPCGKCWRQGPNVPGCKSLLRPLCPSGNPRLLHPSREVG